jgi:hypothetical protein
MIRDTFIDLESRVNTDAEIVQSRRGNSANGQHTAGSGELHEQRVSCMKATWGPVEASPIRYLHVRPNTHSPAWGRQLTCAGLAEFDPIGVIPSRILPTSGAPGCILLTWRPESPFKLTLGTKLAR